jgi:hypothetical protein
VDVLLMEGKGNGGTGASLLYIYLFHNIDLLGQHFFGEVRIKYSLPLQIFNFYLSHLYGNFKFYVFILR